MAKTRRRTLYINLTAARSAASSGGSGHDLSYRSILTPIQFDDPKQILVMHSAMRAVLTLSPLAQEKAAHLRLQRESAGAREARLNEARSAFFCGVPCAISALSLKICCRAHAWDALAKVGRC